MAYLHAASSEALRSELDLWALPPTQTVLEQSQWIPFKPVSSIDQSNTIEFCVPGTGSEYLDGSHTLIGVRGKLVDAAGNDIPAPRAADGDNPAIPQNHAAPVNYTLPAAFCQTDIMANSRLLSQSSPIATPYRSVFETQLGFAQPALQSIGTLRMWYKDTAGAMDAVNPGTNAGRDKRYELAKESKIIDMIGPIHADLFNQPRFLLNNVELRIKLTRNRDAFMIMSPTRSERFVILDATLYVRKVKLSPSVLLAHASALESAPARYPITRVDVKTETITQGVQSKSIPNLHIGQVPKRIVIGFVTNTAFNGSYTENPFNFQHFNLSYLALYVDSQQIPAQPLTPDFAKGAYAESYQTLFTGTGLLGKDQGIDISYEDYGKGYTLFAFDLSPDLSANEGHWNLQKQGVVKLELRYSQPLAQAINCIVYSEFSNLIEIDKNRQVIVDYSV